MALFSSFWKISVLKSFASINVVIIVIFIVCIIIIRRLRRNIGNVSGNWICRKRCVSFIFIVLAFFSISRGIWFKSIITSRISGSKV